MIDDLVEIKLLNSDDFLKVKETLTRIGVASRKEKKLYQSCHILHKKGLYYLVHFKELFLLDGKQSSFSEEDRARRNTVTNLLAEWGLVTIVNESKTQDPIAPLSQIKILPFKDKVEWELIPKYNIGVNKA